jgi:hypothetical protein
MKCSHDLVNDLSSTFVGFVWEFGGHAGSANTKKQWAFKKVYEGQLTLMSDSYFKLARNAWKKLKKGGLEEDPPFSCAEGQKCS